MRIFAIAVSLFVLAYAGTSAVAQSAQVRAAAPNSAEDVAHGAVLCHWYIYRELVAIGETCLHDRDAAFQEKLKIAIRKIDRFIIDNTPMSPTQLSETKKGRGLMDDPAKLCQADGLHLYKLLEDQGAGVLDKSVSSLPSVPRRPAMAPCL